MKQYIVKPRIRKKHTNDFCSLCMITLSLIISVGCATAKTVRKSNDIQDDGKSNIVVLSYDMKIYATDKYPTQKNIRVSVHCPESSRLTQSECFNLVIPFKGRKIIDDYSMNAFEANSAKVMRLKYGEYTATRANYSVLIDKVPDVFCHYGRRRFHHFCHRDTIDLEIRHQLTFPEPLSIPVSSGTGCYLGHISMTVADGEVQDSKMEYGTELTPERLASISDELQSAVKQHVVRPCST